MTAADFIASCLLVDLEVNERGEVYTFGAALGARALVRRAGKGGALPIAELEDLTREASYLLGHNLLGHDLPQLRARAPHLALLGLPVVDTLYLSPLAFPENPYHRLVKNYKLVRDAANDPLADARLAARLFADQWESLSALGKSAPEVLALYRYFLGGDAGLGGLGLALEAMGAEAVGKSRDEKDKKDERDLKDGADLTDLAGAGAGRLFSAAVESRVCREALAGVLSGFGEAAGGLAPYAYALAWLRVAGGNSVLPRWVRGRFPETAAILRRLRGNVCADPGCAYCREIHDPARALRAWFGFDAFRPEPRAADGGSLQEAIVHEGASDRPLFAILPTGGGKSLCYQIPALMRHQRRGALTVVVSPLQALMKDQVDNLRKKTGTAAAVALSGLLTPPERGEVLDAVRLGDAALLYISPEQLRNRSCVDALDHREIGAWVLDEAHCLSKWGHDFRPDYLYAARFIREFAGRRGESIPPVQCFTATAKEDVKSEILDHFRRELGQELSMFEGGVERANLSFEVQAVNRAEKYIRIHELLTERLGSEESSGGAAVVYAATREGAERIAEFLRGQGWAAAHYHGTLDPAAKRHVQENFLAGATRVICATNAFGMGIDKEDVRLVVHADIPGSLENYIQEAGRAGRDNLEADCVLLYDEEDVDRQFRMGAMNRLSREDIAQILRGLRRARRDESGRVVLTSGELLQVGGMDVSFDASDPGADTKVRAAISWLERAGFVERNENRTQVFQGRPQVADLDEARRRMAGLGLSKRQQARWLAILEALMNAEGDRGFSADELAQVGCFAPVPGEGRETETASQRVIRTLHAMAEAGLIRKSLLLTAFVRHRVADDSAALLARATKLENAMLDLMQAEAPDAGLNDWQTLSLRRLNQRLLDDGFISNPETLRGLLQGLARDGQGLAAGRGSLALRPFARDLCRVKLQRDWPALRETARRRQQVAEVTLRAILGRVPKEAAGANLLVEFAAEDVLEALRHDLFLSGQLQDPLAAVDRALMHLHEQRVVTLQHGLAVFRQAMTITVAPDNKRRYTKGDFEPISRHYGEQVFQVHVINEYARMALEKVSHAIALVLAYFSQEKSAFVKRYFAGRDEVITRATSEQSYQRLVEDLANPVQQAIVAADADENMLVLAGPGSGKTRVVAHRCGYLLRVLRARPESVLVLCFNRHAAMTLRRRLRDLVGDDARGVTVQTYHGLALQLTGRSLAVAAETRGEEPPDFDAPLTEAVELLRGRKEIPGLAPDEVRERLLAGCRHILVDEYQDIDELQYELVAALAGRAREAPEGRLAILAVGDDDQNIYQFRGANVAFIRRFREDYQARVHMLAENYRSTAHILTAAAALIRANRDRMKGDAEIRVNRARAGLPPGGDWEGRDPLAKGRVQRLRVQDAAHQARALVAEMERLRQLAPGGRWSDFAVLAREWSVLGAVRGLCEERGIPVACLASAEKLPPLHRVREIARFLDFLKERREGLFTVDELLAEVAAQTEDVGNPWRQALERMLADWREEAGEGRLPVAAVVEFLHEALADQRRGRTHGEGVQLATVHTAKGLEWDQVLVADGGWKRPAGEARMEEERRLYYVAMTRARQNLVLFVRDDCGNPHAGSLSGDFLLDRPGGGAGGPGGGHAAEAIRTYEFLGLADLDLGFAGARPAGDPIHRHLAALAPCSRLQAALRSNRVFLLDAGGQAVAALSQAGTARLRATLSEIREVRVMAMIRRRRQDEKGDFGERCRVESWELPFCELVREEPGT